LKSPFTVLLDTIKEVGIEVKAKKTEYLFMLLYHTTGHHYTKVASRCVEDVVKFKYFGTALTNQNCIQEEIKSRINLGNGCYYAVHSLWSSHL
jgi:hypothetical protein